MKIETRTLSNEAIEKLYCMTPDELDKTYRNGDYLYIWGLAFVMVEYSATTTTDGQQSRFVSWWCELYDIQLDCDYDLQSIDAITPVCVDWRSMGR